MACLIVPSVVAGFTTAFRKKLPKNLHIEWLNTMLWGGALALAVEHIAHQEIVPYFPFLTAMHSSSEAIIMLKEMASVGIPMTIAVISIWAVAVLTYEKVISPSKARG